MSRPPVIWAAGLGGSVLAHAALLGVLMLAIDPDDVADQPMPQTRMEVDAYELERTEAPQSTPQTEAANEADAEGAKVDAGAIPQSVAKASDARPEVAAAAAPEIAPTPAADPDVTTTLAAAPELTQISAAPAETAVSAVTEPVFTQTTPAAADPVPVALAPAVATPTAEVTPTPVAAIAAAPQGEKVKAALAFSGAGDGPVDPVSLAAFQSFMQPGDAKAEGDPLRDGVSALLSQVPCSRLQVGFDPDTASLQVNGHIPEGDMRAPVLAALRQQMGADIAVSDNILILPRPQCGALSGIASVGLPQSTDQITNPLLIGEDTHATVFRFSEGNLLSLDMTAPDYDAYIYLDYFDAKGNVLHLEPNEHVPLRQATAKTAHQIGARTMEDEGLKLVVGPPYGQEIAVAFAASEPLYDGLRPIQEPAEGYLDWLRERVADARAQNADFKGEWVYFFVSTSAE